MTNDKKSKLILIIGGSISVFLLVLFMALKANDFYFMELNTQWLLVAGIPLLLSLILGGYIKNFKGFGIELEADLKSTLPSSLVEPVIFTTIEAMRKGTINYLHNLSREKKLKTKSLKFVSARPNYYDAPAVGEYLHDLIGLDYLEIVDRKGKFLYLLPSSILRAGNQIDDESIRTFIFALEKSRISETYLNALREGVPQSATLIEVYQKMLRFFPGNANNIQPHALPVLNNTGEMVGIVYKEQVERKILEDVIKNYNNRS